MNPTTSDRNISSFLSTGPGSSINLDYLNKPNPNDSRNPVATPVTTPDYSISSPNLANTSPVVVNPTPTSTTANNVISDISSTSAIQKENDAKIAQAQKESQSSTNDLKNTMQSILDINSTKSQLEQNAGIAQKTYAKNEIDNLIEAKSLAITRQLEDIQKNKIGATQSGVSESVRSAQNQGARELADLSIIQNARNRDLLTAQTLVDKKVELLLEPLKTKLEFQKMFYEDNKAELTKAEDRAFQLQIKASDREYETTKEKAKTLETTKLDILRQMQENDAPLSAMQDVQSATSSTDVITKAGKYGIDVTKVLQRKKLEADINKLNMEAVTNGIPPLTNPTAAPYATALNVILGSSKLTKDQKATVINSINSGQDAFSVVKNQAKDIMGQTEATKLTNYEVARDTLSDIGKQLKAYYDAGGDTGIISGNFEKVVNKLGQVNDPNLVALATQLQGNIQVYRNAISGTAYSNQEGKDITSIFPGINKSKDLNDAILKGRSTLFDSVIDSTYKTVLGNSYGELKKANEPLADVESKVTDAVKMNPSILEPVKKLYTSGLSPDKVYEYMKLHPEVYGNIQ